MEKFQHAVFHPTNCRAQHNQRDCLQPPGCCLLVPGDEPFFSPFISSVQYRGLFKLGDDISWRANHCHSHHKALQKIKVNAVSVYNVLFRHR